MSLKLLLATNNQGKLREYQALFSSFPVELITPRQADINIKVAETGSTYAENARLKAGKMAEESHMVSMADDSGLEVDALNGDPGIRSARYAGENASDRERVKYLLNKLEGVPLKERTARFVCVIVIVTPDGRVEVCSGECSGIIAFKPKGSLGFGYDPVFYFPELGKTMAELPMSQKNEISHRGQAARKAAAALRKLDLLS